MQVNTHHTAPRHVGHRLGAAMHEIRRKMI
jgi:hypothetical protein